MLDDLDTALGTDVKWVGGSASRHDEQAFGQVSTAENATEGWDPVYVGDPPENYWSKELEGELGEDQTLQDALDQATANDGVNVIAGEVVEHGQSIARNGGSTIKLKDPEATSHHAILWGGQADHMRHFNNIQNVRDALIGQWGPVGANVTITTLFGDGANASDGSALPAEWNAQPATKANLLAALNALAPSVNTNEQFFFYASDHGDVETDIALASVVPGDGTASYMLELSGGELQGMAQQPDNVPTLLVVHPTISPGNAVTVSINGFPLGGLNPTSPSTLLPVPEGILGCHNSVVFSNLTPAPVDIALATIRLGGIDTHPPDGAAPVCTAAPVLSAGLPGRALLLALPAAAYRSRRRA